MEWISNDYLNHPFKFETSVESAHQCGYMFTFKIIFKYKNNYKIYILYQFSIS